MSPGALELESNLALLLTASVDPKGMPGSTRADPSLREQDYVECLTYYLKHHPRVRKLVFYGSQKVMA